MFTNFVITPDFYENILYKLFAPLSTGFNFRFVEFIFEMIINKYK